MQSHNVLDLTFRGGVFINLFCQFIIQKGGSDWFSCVNCEESTELFPIKFKVVLNLTKGRQSVPQKGENKPVLAAK